MLAFFRKLFKPRYQSLNLIKIEAKNILDNFSYLKLRQNGTEIFPVLKANAYGHGLREMCLILNKSNAPMVVVDSFPEAQIVWRYFKKKVLIIGEMSLATYDYCRLNKTEFVVYSTKTLRHLARYGKRAKIHLFYNSGMNREGIKDIREFITLNKKFLKAVDVVGFCSHLSSAEEKTVLNQAQIDKFLQGLKTIREAGYNPRWIHLGNSAATLTLNLKWLTAYRPGLSLYGYDPLQDDESFDFNINSDLKPALELLSTVVFTQKLEPEEIVSYNAQYRARTKTNIALIPFGYFEGLDRRLSNKADFYVKRGDKKIWLKVAGKVCMNLTCLDFDQKDIRVGDRITLISPTNSDVNSIQGLAKIMKTIPYEVLVKLQGNIRREIIW